MCRPRDWLNALFASGHFVSTSDGYRTFAYSGRQQQVNEMDHCARKECNGKECNVLDKQQARRKESETSPLISSHPRAKEHKPN